MKFSDLLAMSLNNLRRRKLRTVLTVLGVIIGTASIVVMMSLGIGLNEMQKELISSYGSLTAIQVYSDHYWGGESGEEEPLYLTEDTVKQMQGIEHVTSVYPLLEVQAMMMQGKYSSHVTLTGAPQAYLEEIPLGQGQIPSLAEKEMTLIYGNMIGQWFSDGKAMNMYGGGETLPDVDFMGKPMFVIFDVDKYYQAMSGGPDAPSMPKKYVLKAAGVVEGGQKDYNDYSYGVYTRLDLLESQLKRIFKKNPIPGQPTNKKGKPYPYFIYSSCVVNVDDMENVKAVQEQLINMGYQAHSNAEWMEQTQKQSNITQAVLGGIGAVSLFVAAIGIANTMMMSIYERTKEIGIMKVLGCDMGVIRNMFLIESGFIGFIGGVTGVVFSYMLSFSMNKLLAIGQAMMGREGDISRIPPWLAMTAIGFAVLVGMAAGFFPAVRAMKLSPLAAIRND